MRNPNRIPEVLELLGKAWAKYPDLRLVQLLWAVDIINNENDGFAKEEDAIKAKLIKFIESN